MLGGKQKNNHYGFTLVELIVVIGIFVTVGIFIIGGFNQTIQALAQARSKVIATAIANEKIEIIRNMPYDQLGTTTGWPPGDIPSSQTINRDNFEFILETRIDYIDDPFDGNAEGTIPGKPIDTVPNDYKKTEISIKWNKPFAQPFLFSTIAVPSGLESAANTGSLLIQVFDANGRPIPQANVHITNLQVQPVININNITDNLGNLQVLSLPPSIASYHIVVSKNNYSTDSTYPIDPINLPHPVKPDVSIIEQQVTEISFAIDLTSTLTIHTVNDACQAIPNIPLSIWGEKLIGTNPETLKYSSEPPTNDQGNLVLNNLEWDNYTLIETSDAYDVAGVIPPVLLDILPNTTQTTSLVLTNHTPNSLRVTVKDSGTKTALMNASVTLSKDGFEQNKLTGYGYFEQNDWSGGPGQQNFIDFSKYESDDNNIDTTTTPGNLMLKKTDNQLNFSEEFNNTNYEDTTTTSADWNTNLGQVQLAPEGEHYKSTGNAQSIKLNTTGGKITKATINVNESLNNQIIQYYLSADGGVNFETVDTGLEHTFINIGDDLRFRAVLSSNDPHITPVLLDYSINYLQTRYTNNAYLISSSFDTGNESNFGTINWMPIVQLPETGLESIKFQIASNNDNTTWNFIGPDRTANTYYTVNGSSLNTVHNNNKFIKYKIYLSTINSSFTPIISNIKIGYTSQCIPPGQVFFENLDNDDYTINISLAGYNSLATSVTINGTTQNEYFLTPS